MERFTIEPILSSALPDVASFLRDWHGSPNHDGSACLSIERRLRWLLIENPLTANDSHHGFCIRDSQGAIRGTNLSFPAAFLAGDQRLRGLCSGSYFVEPQARILGYYLFKKYLASPGYSFFFANTCNANSGALWAKLGGCAAPDSETEYIFPLKLDVMLSKLVALKTSSEFALGLARMLGRSATPVLQLLTRRPSGLSVEPCQDWQKLSELSRRHRSADYVTSDRSPEFLQWRYGPTSPYAP